MNENGAKKRLRRSRENRILTGVCGGIAEYVNIEANLLRLAFAAFTLFFGSGVILYILAWLVIPEQGEDNSIIEGFVGNMRDKGSTDY